MTTEKGRYSFSTKRLLAGIALGSIPIAAFLPYGLAPTIASLVPAAGLFLLSLITKREHIPAITKLLVAMAIGIAICVELIVIFSPMSIASPEFLGRAVSGAFVGAICGMLVNRIDASRRVE